MTDDHFSDIPEITTPSNVDEGRFLDGIDIESDKFNRFFKEKACIWYILIPGAYCQNWTN